MPFNLGPIINTKYDELASFVDPDDHTFYFNSNGHTTIGGYDIFRATMNEEGEWLNPENIGYPINTVNDDLNFILTSDGERGYYSHNHGEGKADQEK